jgi:dephospho-CoA kinase
MLLIGLTGSIATGKSTTSTLLSSPPYSLPIIDADLLARQAVEPGTWGYNRIISTFLPSTPDLLLPASDPLNSGREDGPSGKGRYINRPALGRRVFGESESAVEARKKLGRIVHPAVRFYMLRSLVYYYIRGHWAVILDVPLLFEGGLDMFCSTVIVVAVSKPEIQLKRLMDRDAFLSREDAENRVKSQTDVREKAKRALDRGRGRGEVLWNDGGREDLEVQLKEVMGRLQRGSPRWWGWLLLACPPLMGGVAVWEVLLGWLRRRREIKARGEELPKAKL